MRRIWLSFGALLVLFTIAGATPAQEPADRNGHYVPQEDIVFGDHRIEWFELETVSYQTDEGPDYRRPRMIRPKSQLVVTRIADEKQFRYPFQNPRVAGESVFLAFARTPMGAITIQGEFLDKRGSYWNQPDVIRLKTPVFEGTVSVVKIGRPIAFRNSRFVYWDGR